MCSIRIALSILREGARDVSNSVFQIPTPPTIPIVGSAAVFPPYRIFCVGRNYEAHAREMGFEPDRKAPFYFVKSVHDIVLSGATIPYPPGTSNFQYEMELVVALGKAAFEISALEAKDCIYGYACGLDMTRRDLQIIYREKQRPWDLGKDFENSAAISSITPVEQFSLTGEENIKLSVNGVTKHLAQLASLIWSVPELISDLSRFYHLVPGDLLYTGTPEGVGPVLVGDHLLGSVDGLEPVKLTISGPS